jgi:two-component system NtrC family response regulator
VRELRTWSSGWCCADDGRIAEEDLPAELRGRLADAAAAGAFRLAPTGLRWEEHERSVLEQALVLAHGNRARAARLVDLPYKAFLYRLEKHALAPREEVPETEADS